MRIIGVITTHMEDKILQIFLHGGLVEDKLDSGRMVGFIRKHIDFIGGEGVGLRTTLEKPLGLVCND